MIVCYHPDPPTYDPESLNIPRLKNGNFNCRQAGNLNVANHALYLCTYDPLEMAEFALEWRDIFINTNWKKMGFHDDLAIRIALHTEKCQIIRENSKIVNVIGRNVNVTARIEPVVESNQVYCSELFYKTIISDENHNFNFYSLGKQKLAKEYGEMELYIMMRHHESYKKSTVPSDTTSFDIPETKLRRKFTELEKNEFVRKSYNTIPQYFQDALQNLKSNNDDIATKHNIINSEKFICEVYQYGKLQVRCKIWVGEEYNLKSIFYSENFSISDNSYHESLTVDDDGYNLYLESLMGRGSLYGEHQNFYEAKDAAKYLWTRFISSLQ